MIIATLSSKLDIHEDNRITFSNKGGKFVLDPLKSLNLNYFGNLTAYNLWSISYLIYFEVYPI